MHGVITFRHIGAQKPGRIKTIPTENEFEFIKLVAAGIAPHKAAQQIYGSNNGHLGKKMLENPLIARKIKELHAASFTRHKISRTRVIDGLIRAAEMAETMADPTGMVAAYREIGKMMGYYAVETKKVEVNVTGEVGLRRLNTLTDEQLLKIASGETLEGEFVQVEPGYDPETAGLLLPED